MYKRRVTQDGVTVMNKELYDNLQDGIDELKNSQFLEMSGEEIVCDSSKKGGLFLSKLFGKSTQRTTTGSQYFDASKISKIDNASFESLDDGYILIATGGIAHGFLHSSCSLDPSQLGINGKTVYLIADSITASLNENTGSIVQAYYVDVNGMMQFFNLYKGTNVSTNFYIPENCTDLVIGIYTNNTDKALDVDNTVTVKGLRLSLSNNTPWEPYTGGIPSPSPEYPQAVENCENTEVVVYGKNLIESTEKTIESSTGVTVTINKEGIVVLNGTSVTNDAKHIGTVDVKRGITYMLSGCSGDSYGCRLDLRVSEGVLYKYPGIYDIGSGVTFTPTEDLTLIVAVRWEANIVFNNLVLKPMIRLASVEDATYEPYKAKQSLTIPYTLCGIPVSSGGNYTDDNGQEWVCDEVDFERGVYVQRLTKIQLTSDMQWSISNSGNRIYTAFPFNSNISIKDKTPVICNCALYGEWNNNNTKNTVCVGNGSIPLCGFSTLDFPTVADFTMWLDARTEGVYIITLLATPIETPLTAEQIAAYYSLKSHDRFTRISNDKNLGISAKIPTTDAAGLLGLSLQDSFFNSVFTSTERELKDTKKGGLRFNKIFGKSKQESVNGYQLFDASKLPTKTQGGATVTNNGDGSFTISGSGTLTDTCSASYWINNPKFLKEGLITVDFGSKTYPVFGVQIKSSTGILELTNAYGTRESKELKSALLNGDNLQLSINYYGASGQPIIAGTVKPMLYQDGDGTWEEFTGGVPSPNPEFPQEIVSCENTEVSVYGGNLFGGNSEENPQYDGHNYCDLGGKYGFNADYNAFVIPIIENKSYYFWGNFADTSLMIFHYLNSDREVISTYTSLYGKKEGIIPALANAKFIRFSLKTTDKMNIMLNMGTEALPYEPYKEQSLTIPYTLRGIPVTDASIANYTDENGQMWVCDEVDFERGVYVQRTILKSFSKVNVFLDTGKTYFYCDIKEMAHTQSFYCNLAKHETNTMKYGNVWKADSRLIIGNADANGSPVLSSVDELFSNIDMFEILGILATPIETPLDKATLGQFLSAKTNEGVTIIHTNSVIEPEISVSYGKSEVTAKSLLAENLERNSIKYSDVVDNLLSDADNLPLSAKQGKVLKNAIDEKNVYARDICHGSYKGLRVIAKLNQNIMYIAISGTPTENIQASTTPVRFDLNEEVESFYGSLLSNKANRMRASASGTSLSIIFDSSITAKETLVATGVLLDHIA